MNPSPVRLVDIGTYVPPRRIANLDALAKFDLDPEFLTNKIGVLERSIKDDGETTSELCRKAFADLVQRTRVDIKTVQLICVVTQNPETNIPHTAAILHNKLGAEKHCLTFDISQGCAGFVHGLSIVVALVEKLGLANALLFTGDPYSTIVDPNDKATSLIFGDAASVSFISRDQPGYAPVDSDFGTVPNSWQCLRCDDGRFKMDGRLVFSHAAREVPQSIHRVLERRGLGIADVDRFLLHPGSKYIIDVLRQTLKVPAPQLPFEITGYGNTVSSSIPLMLKDYVRRDRKDARILVSGFGVGFSWGTSLLEFQE